MLRQEDITWQPSAQTTHHVTAASQSTHTSTQTELCYIWLWRVDEKLAAIYCSVIEKKSEVVYKYQVLSDCTRYLYTKNTRTNSSIFSITVLRNPLAHNQM